MQARLDELAAQVEAENMRLGQMRLQAQNLGSTLDTTREMRVELRQQTENLLAARMAEQDELRR